MRVPRQLLRDLITVEDYAGSGAMGPVFGAPRVVRASVQPTQRLVVDERGQTVTSDTLVIVRPEDGPVVSESRVLIGGSMYRVAQEYAMPDARRPTHYELLVTRWASA